MEMDVPSLVTLEFMLGSLRLRSWTLSRKQHLVSVSANVSVEKDKQSEQLELVIAQSKSIMFK